MARKDIALEMLFFSFTKNGLGPKAAFIVPFWGQLLLGTKQDAMLRGSAIAGRHWLGSPLAIQAPSHEFYKSSSSVLVLAEDLSTYAQFSYPRKGLA